MSLAVPHLAEPYSTPCLNFLALLALKYTTSRKATPHPAPISRSLGWRLGNGLENKLSSPSMTAIIFAEASCPGDVRHRYATLSQKYPTRIYGRFISTSFFVSIPSAFSFRFFGTALKSLAMPSMIPLIGSAPCPCFSPGFSPCYYPAIQPP